MRSALLCLSAFLFCCLGITTAQATDPRGTWLIDRKVAVQVYDCGAALCARIVWLEEPYDRSGAPKRDWQNPIAALRERALCGMLVLSGLHPTAEGSWQGGSFYNPDDGRRYSADAVLRADDTLVARFYVGLPLLGEDRTLQRIAGPGESPRLRSCGVQSAESPASRPDAVSLR
jgi:uncharacterized protein (DUF2147 family)